MRSLPMAVLDRLLLDAPAEVTPGTAPRAVEEHQRHRSSWYAPLVAGLLLPETVLAAAARGVGARSDLPVTVLVPGGAGGLVALTRRQHPGLRVTAAVTTLQDLDDLGGAAARAVAAAQQLEQVEVYVGLPAARGWERAVEVVEAAGLCAAVTAGPGPGGAPGLAQQLSVLVEADLPFLVHSLPADGDRGAGQDPALAALGLLRAVDALVEGGSPAAAAELLDPATAAEAVDDAPSWDEDAAARVRRRLRRAVLPVGATAAGLGRLGLVSVPGGS